MVCCRWLDWKWIILTSWTMRLSASAGIAALTDWPRHSLYPSWLRARLLGTWDWLNYRSHPCNSSVVIIHINYIFKNKEGGGNSVLREWRGTCLPVFEAGVQQQQQSSSSWCLEMKRGTGLWERAGSKRTSPLGHLLPPHPAPGLYQAQRKMLSSSH